MGMRSSGGKPSLIDLPSSVVSSSQTLLDIRNYGALEGEEHHAVTTAAIEAAQTDGISKPGNYAVLFPEGEWFYDTTLIKKLKWVGATPGKVKLKMVSVAPFTYVEHSTVSQAAIVNQHFQLTYNAATADPIDCENIDFYFTNQAGSGVTEVSGLMLANVRGGSVVKCRFFTEGAGRVALFDIFACGKNTSWYDCESVNTTEATHGGCWVRNRTTESGNLTNATEGNRFYNCHLSGSTEDEVFSIFGSLGMCRDNIFKGGSITALASSKSHAKLTSIFAKSNAKSFAVTSNTEVGSSVINMTGSEGKGFINGARVFITALTASVTGLVNETAYFVVGATANSFELSLTEGGAGIKVAGHALEGGTTILGGGTANSAVEGCYFIDTLFIDENSTLKSGGNLGVIGTAEDATNIVQNNGYINCTAKVKSTLAAPNKIAAFREVLCRFDGAFSGNKIDNPYITAVGSTEPIENAILGFSSVIAPRIKGNVTYGVRNCGTVRGGRIEATSRLFYDCALVLGVTGIIPNATGFACHAESSTNPVVTMRSCVITGGAKLLNVNAAVTSATHIDVQGNTMNTTAEAGTVVAAGSAARVRLRGNTLFGPKELTRSGTAIAESVGNDWYGTLEQPTVFVPSLLKLPTAVSTYKETAGAATEARKALAENFDRTLALTNVPLTSGIPVCAAIPIKAGQLIRGVGFYVATTEAAAVDRTHLWVAVLGPGGKVVGVGLDYTSSANNELGSSSFHALLLETAYETAEEGLYYAVLCEVMSANAPVIISGREGKGGLLGAAPALSVTAPGGQTTPGLFTGSPALTAAALQPYMCFV